MNKTLNNLSKDISLLQSKIHHNGFVVLLHKLSAASSNLYSWLKSNPDIRNSISDPNIYDSLILLGKIKEENAGGITEPILAKYFIDHQSDANLIPIIKSFMPLIGTDVDGVLSPYNDAIMGCKIFSTSGMASSSNVHDDLKIIHGRFQEFLDMESDKKPRDAEKTVVKKKTKTILLTKMLSYLLNRFSSEIANAASVWGYDELSSLLKSGSILMKPMELSKYINVGTPNQYMVSHAKRIYKEISNNLENQEWAYQFSKEAILYFCGEVTKEELNDLYIKRSLKEDNLDILMKDPLSFEKNVMGKDYPVLEVNSFNWLNKNVLILISLLLNVIMDKIS